MSLQPRLRTVLGMAMLAAIAPLVAACGPISDDRQHPLPQGRVDQAFAQKEPTSTTPSSIFNTPSTASSTTTTTIAPELVTIYLVEGAQIRSVQRRRTNANPGSPVTVQELFGHLKLPAPTTDPRLSNPHAPTMLLALAPNDPPVVALANTVIALPPAEQARLVAQVVFTLTTLPGVGSVYFVIDGNYWQPPAADGTLPDGAGVFPRRVDYAGLIAP